MVLLGVGIWLQSHAGRVAAVMLIAVTTFKCFLYDLSSLAASIGSLRSSVSAISLALVVARASEVRSVAAARHRVTLTAFVLSSAIVAQASDSTGVPIRERGIEVASAGPQRLAPDAALLAGAAPFRVIHHAGPPEPRRRDRGGRASLICVSSRRAMACEVPYLFVSRQGLSRAIEGTLPLCSRGAQDHERLRGGPPRIVRGRSTGSARRSAAEEAFLKRDGLEGSGDRERWTMVVGGGDGDSTCRIEGLQQPRACRLRQAPIATCASPGTTGTVVVCRLPRRSGRGFSGRAAATAGVRVRAVREATQRTALALSPDAAGRTPADRRPPKLDVGGTYVSAAPR